MKPAPFQYTAPETVEESLVLLHTFREEGKPLAGGQSLVPLLNMRLARPSVLIDLNRVRELSYIHDEDATVSIGAMTRQRAVELSSLVREKLPLLAEAVRYIGHPQIRNRGTVGGSLAHADPAAELPVVTLVLGAQLVVRGLEGTRVLRPEEFFVSFLQTALAPEELLVEVRFPVHRTYGTAFLEVARRHGDYALVGVAAMVQMDGERCTEARLGFTGVGPVPVRLPEAEEAATGRPLDDSTLGEIARIVAARLDPHSDIHASATYRKEVAGILAGRALRLAAERFKQREGA
ncbi:MAG: xanthine dehydrogenase family protein subunit M [Armatimonadota bacterium]|nr:xanthine dehydrogenase family protein subunit M [Armatimonadota bacterium]MDR5702074.1 xanthine dehydrogenase family protein subunit M [Armatimonadota bacterium]MDR7434599.1 xanthine dehydrogenase family protein subunit M [Armatimonadota bacterium]